MTKYPLVTIITSTLNAEKYLRESIKSVINQSYKNYEYIIIDGSSTDGTIDILKEHEREISYWISEPDTGIYEAWNKGIEQSHGEWIIFIGADDQLTPNALEDYINFINNNANRQFSYISSKIKRINLNGTLEGVVGQAWKWNEFKLRMTTAHPGSFHSRLLFQEYGKFNTNYKIVSDYEMLLRPKENLRAGYVDKITVHMLTGSRFNDLETLLECLAMQKDQELLSKVNYSFHYINIIIRHLIKKILR